MPQALEREIEAILYDASRPEPRATLWWAGPYEAEARREREHPLAPVRGLLVALVLALCFWGLVALYVALKVGNR